MASEMQDNTYPANTADPYLAPQRLRRGLQSQQFFGQGTSSTSPDIMAQVVQGGVALTSAPIHNLNARLYYNIDERDVSMNQCNVSGDKACAVWGGGASPDSSASTATYVVPQEWLKQKVGGTVDYHLWPRT